MTIDDNVNRLGENALIIDNTQDKSPFHIVLVDIRKVANKEIHCVEKPLAGTEDLKFVALSYRWGELHETIVDTGVGYLATITSFDLRSFCKLCQTMVEEIDLKHMKYVWVDAICVDQANPSKRKATIYQMTNIYERANYIVAVPDLHLEYLEQTSKLYHDTIVGSDEYREYLYHLIQGNMQKLVACDHEFLDIMFAPKNRPLRDLLMKYTDHFAIGLTTCKLHDRSYNPAVALGHIYETNAAAATVAHAPPNGIKSKLSSRDHVPGARSQLQTNEQHTCDDGDYCQLLRFDPNLDGVLRARPKLPYYYNLNTWKYLIPERSATLRQSMRFMTDLIKDWSSRVWVISEYHIAKRKNIKMKYWFIQLQNNILTGPRFPTDQKSFFEFDFDQCPSISSACVSRPTSRTAESTFMATGKLTHETNAVYRTFHATLRQQLSQQTFVEKMLKSKASKNGDRFHSILPSSEYKNQLVSQDQVDQWNITTLISVKLELYKWMSTKDKLELLFRAFDTYDNNKVLPTFATSNICWSRPDNYAAFTGTDDGTLLDNFDLNSPSTIRMSRTNNGRYKINIKPKEYYQHIKISNPKAPLWDLDDAMVNKLLKLQLPFDDYDIVCICPATDRPPRQRQMNMPRNTTTPSRCLYMALWGSFATNQWILAPLAYCLVFSLGRTRIFQLHRCDKNSVGFDIY